MATVSHQDNPSWLHGPLLRGVSRSFYLTLRVLPAGLRQPLSLAYLLARTSDTIADSITGDPQLRLSKLDEFRQAVAGVTYGLAEIPKTDLTNPWESKLLAAVPGLLGQLATQQPETQRLIRSVIATITEGQANDIAHFEQQVTADCRGTVTALPDAAALNQYTFQVAGCVGDFWTRLCSLYNPRVLREQLEPLAAKGIRFGMGLQLVNILRDLPEDLANGRCYLPADELTLANCQPGDLLTNPKQADPVFRTWLQHAREHLEFAHQYVTALRGWRITFASRLPLALANATLDRLGESVPTAKIKVSRCQLRQLALREALKSF